MRFIFATRDYKVNAVIVGDHFSDEMNLMFKNDLESSSVIEPAV
jgi:hypothetical protein